MPGVRQTDLSVYWKNRCTGIVPMLAQRHKPWPGIDTIPVADLDTRLGLLRHDSDHPFIS